MEARLRRPGLRCEPDLSLYHACIASSVIAQLALYRRVPEQPLVLFVGPLGLFLFPDALKNEVDFLQGSWDVGNGSEVGVAEGLVDVSFIHKESMQTRLVALLSDESLHYHVLSTPEASDVLHQLVFAPVDVHIRRVVAAYKFDYISWWYN